MMCNTSCLENILIHHLSCTVFCSISKAYMENHLHWQGRKQTEPGLVLSTRLHLPKSNLWDLHIEVNIMHVLNCILFHLKIYSYTFLSKLKDETIGKNHLRSQSWKQTSLKKLPLPFTSPLCCHHFHLLLKFL